MLAFGLDTDEGIPAGAERIFDYPSDITGVRGWLESFEDGELESVDSSGSGKETGQAEEGDVRVMNAIGAFNGVHDPLELRVGAEGERGCTEDENQYAKRFHLCSPLSALAMGFDDCGLVFNLGIPNSPPRSAS